MSTPRVEERTVSGGALAVTYTLTRKRVKNLNLRVRADGSVAVSAASHVPIDQIDRFVQTHLKFIAKARARIATQADTREPLFALADGATLPLYGKPHLLRIRYGANQVRVHEGELWLFVKSPADGALCHRVLRKFLREEALRVLTELVRAICPVFAPYPATIPAVTVREMKTRWGVCRPQKSRVTLNARLVHVPPECAAYVVYHELAHFRHPNHSLQFYAWLSALLPDWQQHRRMLNDFVIPHIK